MLGSKWNRFTRVLWRALGAVRASSAGLPMQPHDVLRVGLEQRIGRKALAEAVRVTYGKLKRRGAVASHLEVSRMEEAHEKWIAGAISDEDWMSAVTGFLSSVFDADPNVKAAKRAIRRYSRYEDYEHKWETEAAVDSAHAAVREDAVEWLLQELEEHGVARDAASYGPYR